MGYQFWDDAIKYLTVEAGPGYTYEVFNEFETITTTQAIENNTIVDQFDIQRTESEKRSYATARWAVDFRYWLIEDGLQLFHDHEGLISLQDASDILVRTHTGLRVPIYEGLNILAQFDYDYKNKPAEGSDRVDYRYILGVGYAF